MKRSCVALTGWRGRAEEELGREPMSLTLPPPAHEVGLVSLQVAGREGPLSASVLFEYRARRFLSLPSTQLDWLSLDGEFPVLGPTFEWDALLEPPGLRRPLPHPRFSTLSQLLLCGSGLKAAATVLHVLSPRNLGAVFVSALGLSLCPKGGM